MKRVWYAGICALLLGGLWLTGCRGGNTREREMTEYLQRRYDDTFVCVGEYSNTEKLFRAGRFPDNRIWVMEQADGSYTDNYLDYLYREETEEAIRGMLTETFGCPVVLEYRIVEHGVPSTVPANATPEEYRRGREDAFVFSAVISPAYTAEDAETEEVLLALFDSQGMNIIGDFYFPSSADLFEKIRTGAETKVTEGRKLELIIQDSEIDYSKWSET